MPINFDSALGIHAQALKVRSERAQLLAANLSNADTPGYKARDIDFKSALKSFDNPLQPMMTSHPSHIDSTRMPSPLSHLTQYRTVIQDSLDGNSVDEQVEQSQFMENAVQYQASLNFLGAKFNGLIKALKGE